MRCSSPHPSHLSGCCVGTGHGVHGTSTKLARLAQLAKKSSLFDDPATEIAELTTVVKQVS